MRNTSDMIEHYLKQLLQESADGVIELQRNLLAEQFNCVPSQINYVIGTRFTLEKGYIVESKRGGGGYVRIQKCTRPLFDKIHVMVKQHIGDRLEQSAAEGLIYQLEEEDIITFREANLMRAALHRDTLAVDLPQRDKLRARLMKSMLIALLNK